ncbi:uncharacterized protein LOC110727977 [Chenopodium quinoa]|uniref:uncharacterized protein LOC110727977 n=1 Tax=Chenopodium quinoa TaxID=63459 RepID=UPI000B76C416|nr:uncharacterized protein LOC110727977 [Chenopodium quinoa]
MKSKRIKELWKMLMYHQMICQSSSILNPWSKKHFRLCPAVPMLIVRETLGKCTIEGSLEEEMPSCFGIVTQYISWPCFSKLLKSFPELMRNFRNLNTILQLNQCLKVASLSSMVLIH